MKKKILLSIVFIISLVFILIGIVEANETNEVKLNNIIYGTERIIYGLLKKMVIADMLIHPMLTGKK